MSFLEAISWLLHVALTMQQPVRVFVWRARTLRALRRALGAAGGVPACSLLAPSQFLLPQALSARACPCRPLLLLLLVMCLGCDGVEEGDHEDAVERLREDPRVPTGWT
jgi:hypothetical protein